MSDRILRLQHVEVILIVQAIPASRVHAASYGRRAPRKDKHNVAAPLCHLPFIPGAKTFAHPHKQQKGADSPGDPEHRQEGT